jgi:divalent metal cation (Fe/Co/Zn/Cd) transporter
VTAPDEAMRRATRLCWWQLGWFTSVVLVMGLVLGQSETMKTAWIEDLLGFVPPIAFLVAARLERRERSERFPFGFARANGLGFFVSAVALTAVGALLLVNAVMTLAMAEHATVGSMRLFGRDIWTGWLMLAAQCYALIPPLVIGIKLLPLARSLNDKTLYTNAMMNKANWLTGAAGLAGVIGLGLGWWWADALAAGLISIDIINDGWKALRSSAAELIDGAPRSLDGPTISDDARSLRAALDRRFPDATILMRETGRLIHVEVHGAAAPNPVPPREDLWPCGAESAWRLAQVTFTDRTLEHDRYRQLFSPAERQESR